MSAIKLKQFNSLREKINWTSEKDRHEFIRKSSFVCSDWAERLPKLRGIFSPQEIECLLIDALNYKDEIYNKGAVFVKFVARSGYKHEPEINPLLRRAATPLHHAARCRTLIADDLVSHLFLIYGCDVNYVDRDGFSHFHAACMSGCVDDVKQFIELGQDVDRRVTETGDTPLHVALRNHLTSERRYQEVVELLLKNGANPNLANNDGSTPLHIVCQRANAYCLQQSVFVKMLFELANERYKPLQVDAKDSAGRTPLQLAVSNLKLRVVDILVDRGVDLSTFVFPTDNQFAAQFDWPGEHKQLQIASAALAIVERLRIGGYCLSRSDALAIMKLFADQQVLADSRYYEIFKNIKEYCDDDDEFVAKAKETMVNSSWSLYDLAQSRPEEPGKQVSYKDFYEFEKTILWLEFPGDSRYARKKQLCEKICRRFFLHWTCGDFMKLIHHRMPQECCDMIIENLMNEDLYHICLAATG